MKGMDAVVIGAGVVGLSTARELSARGAKVTLLDGGHPGGEGSRAAAGVAIPSVRLLDDAVMMEFTRAGRAVISEELARLPGAPELRRGSGILRLVTDAKMREELEARAKPHPGWLGGFIPGKELPSLEPALEGTPLLGAFLDTEGFMVDTEAYLNALLHDVAKHGAQVRLSERALRVAVLADRVEVVTEKATLRADRVVLAGGAWSSQLEGFPALPVKALRGQMLTVMHPTLRLTRILSGPTYFAPWRAGEIVVGATEEDAGLHAHNTPAGLLQLLAALARTLPQLREARCVRTWAGLRAATPDGRPLVGAVGSSGRTFVATGHGGQGILTGALTGRALAELMDTGRAPLVEPFSPQRG